MDLTHVQFEGKQTIRALAAFVSSAATVRDRASGPAEPPAETGVNGLAALILERAGLNPQAYRHAALARRVPACVRAFRAASEDAAWTRLYKDPALTPLAVNALLIGVSKFFRDALVFQALDTAVMPALRERGKQVRVLSIGCSSGAEVYSVAMLLAEHGLLGRAHLLGIDCREEAVAKAAAGVYTDGALDGLDAALMARYMEPFEGAWRVAAALRDRAAWRRADATREIPDGPWDIVLCRNVFIYLQHCVVDAMFGKIARELAPHGFLVVGKAERPPATLRLRSVGPCVYTNHVG